MIGVELSTEAAPVLAAARERGLLITLGAPKVLRILPHSSPPKTTSVKLSAF